MWLQLSETWVWCSQDAPRTELTASESTKKIHCTINVMETAVSRLHKKLRSEPKMFWAALLWTLFWTKNVAEKGKQALQIWRHSAAAAKYIGHLPTSVHTQLGSVRLKPSLIASTAYVIAMSKAWQLRTWFFPRVQTYRKDATCRCK